MFVRYFFDDGKILWRPSDFIKVFMFSFLIVDFILDMTFCAFLVDNSDGPTDIWFLCGVVLAFLLLVNLIVGKFIFDKNIEVWKDLAYLGSIRGFF